jgi:hypothetical protein
METNNNENRNQKGSIQQDNEYPGYTSDKQWGDTYNESAENDSIKDARLADSGPLRNPNYHDLTEAAHETSKKVESKTLEDFNSTNPKRDINKTDLNSKDSEYTDNDQS